MTHLYLDGKGAFLTRLRCFNYGTTKGYKVTVEYDGMEQPPFEDYVELDMMLEDAGHTKPKYQHGAIISMPRIMVVLEAHENSYRVGAVYKTDGNTKVTRAETLAAYAEKVKARNEAVKAYEGLPISQQMAIARNRKVQADKAAKIAALESQHAWRFELGEKLHEWARVNPYRIVEIGGEYRCIRKQGVAA